MDASTATRVRRLCRDRLGGPQTRRVPAAGGLEQARVQRPAPSPRGDRPVGRAAAPALRRCAHCRVSGALPRGRWSMPCSATRSWCCSRSTRPRWRSTARRFMSAGPRTTPVTRNSPSSTDDPSREADPSATAKQPHAPAAEVGRAAPYAGRRCAPAHQPHHRRPQAVFPPGARVVPGQGHRGLLRLPHPLAHAQTCPACASGSPEHLLPRAQRALPQRHR